MADDVVAVERPSVVTGLFAQQEPQEGSKAGGHEVIDGIHIGLVDESDAAGQFAAEMSA